MGQKIVVGPISKGLRNDVEPFNVDNDSFPVLVNAYQWRQRIKRKRGTSKLGRLNRYFDSNDPQFNPGTATQVLSAGGAGNLLTGFSGSGIQTNAQIVPGSIIIHDNTTAIEYTDPSLDGTLSPGGTINYVTGSFTITPAAADTVRARFKYYPDLPVLGLENFVADASDFPGMVCFDTTYSYNLEITAPYPIYNVSYYLNPTANAGTLPGYTAKTAWTPLIWNLADYQQVWTTNYQGAMWEVDGITAPFNKTTVGMQYKAITGFAITAAGPPAIANLTIVAHGLIVGDFLFLNEIGGITGANFQTCYVTVVVNANTVTVEFPLATLGGAYTSGGIAQYLTNSAIPTKDCIRWYNGTPVDSASPPVFSKDKGWINFSPPLLSGPNDLFSVSDLPPGQYYLVGARMVVPFKNRLLFFGPIVQTSAADSQVYLQDTVIYSQDGTPFYTVSFAYSTVLPTFHPDTVYQSLLVPTNQTAQPSSFIEDLTGFGGFITAGYARPITSVSINEDALIVGFADRQARLLFTSNDIVPFNFFIINSELGSDSTFSSITLDRGVLSVGGRGIILTSQIASQRVDLEIPDQVFQIRLINQGDRRICAQRDFINEWIYFTYPSNEQPWKFPNQTLQYNYREGTWGLFNEAYTTYGTLRQKTGYTWASINMRFGTWGAWNETWAWGDSTLLQPQVVAGNQQGYVIVRADGTNEGNSLYIQNISSSSVVTSPAHTLNSGDYIVISGVLGTIGSLVNGKIFSVANPTTDTFVLNPTVGTGTYLGGGEIQRMYVPYIQTKQFPVAWEMSRKTRLGVQQYLLSKTSNGQLTLLIFLSQNSASAYNTGTIVPDTDELLNSSLIYSTILYTCPEGTNLGLTPSNINLQLITAQQQNQIWHRVNTSLIGDTVQLGITMNDDQMRDVTFSNQFSEVELHAVIIDVTPSQMLV